MNRTCRWGRDERGRVLAVEPAAAGQADTIQGSEHDGSRPAGFRSYGKSKDHRDDLPQVVVGMAVTRDGIPVRVWSEANAVAFGDIAADCGLHGWESAA